MRGYRGGDTAVEDTGAATTDVQRTGTIPDAETGEGQTGETGDG